MTSRFLRAFSPFVKLMPEVKPPEREVSFKEKFAWTAIVLIIYLIMSNIPLAGVPRGKGPSGARGIERPGLSRAPPSRWWDGIAPHDPRTS